MLRILAAIGLLYGMCFSTAQAANATKLNWMTSYEDALNKAKSEKKPILLFFTGSDWCGWCHKLENEVLDTTDFSDAAGDKFVFVLVDFPLKTPLEPKLAAQNKELQKKFDVKGFPTVVLIDDQQQQIGVTGYRPGGAHSYSDHLLKMVDDFKNYKQKVSMVNQLNTPPAEMQALYQKACELCRKEDANRIVKLGIQSKDNRFFLLERLRFLSDEGQIHDPEAQGIRQQLLAQDPENKFKTHYDVAVIEFEAYTEEMEKEDYSPELAVAPLVAYIERFGESDHDNLWRLQMIIAQVFLDKNKPKEALKYAQASHAVAPDKVQPDIQSFIQNMQAKR